MCAFVNHEHKYLSRTVAVVISSRAVLTGNCEPPDMGVIPNHRSKSNYS